MADQSPGSAAEPIRVFLLDDHEIVRRGIKDLLESAGDIVVVGESGSAPEATRRIAALRPHVAILDGRLPDGSGIDVCREIRSRDPNIAALIPPGSHIVAVRAYDSAGNAVSRDVEAR